MRFVLLALLCGAACRADLFAPPTTVLWNPPTAELDSLWHQNAICTGNTHPRPAVTWYLVLGDTFIGPDGLKVYGVWDGEHSVYLADHDSLPWPRTIRHELLHVLIGDRQHQTDAWTKCDISILG